MFVGFVPPLYGLVPDFPRVRPVRPGQGQGLLKCNALGGAPWWVYDTLINSWLKDVKGETRNSMENCPFIDDSPIRI